MNASRSCLECGEQFIANRKDKKYCSKKCARKNYNYTFINLICPNCNSKFKLEKSDFNARSRRGYKTFFCSISCSLVGNNRVGGKKRLLKCLNCGKEEMVNESYSNDKYCSHKCYMEHDKKRLSIWAPQMARESAKKISETQKERYANGVIHPWLGRNHTEETKNKLSVVRNEYYETHEGYWKGKNLSLETCEKISETRAQRWIDGDYNGSFAKGKIYSKKMNCELYYASSWEKAYMEYLDNLDNVKSIKKDKLRIKYIDGNNHKRNYIVDLIIEYINGSKFLYEIKPAYFVDYKINQLKFAAARKYCEENNMIFEVLTEVELKKMGILT